jgi:hypothetical protein
MARSISIPAPTPRDTQKLLAKYSQDVRNIFKQITSQVKNARGQAKNENRPSPV